MPLGYASAKDGHYLYPDAEAEFTLYNFHSQRQVNEIRDLLLSNDPRSPRVLELFGEPLSGRRYLVRAAAHAASKIGNQKIGVETLSLEGYEPDTPLSHFLDALAARNSGPARQRLSDLAKRVKFEIKVTPFTLLFASLAAKWEVSADEMLGFLEAGARPGPPMSDRTRLSELISRVNPGRLVLQIPDAHIADVAVILRLLDEAELNPNFYLALHYPPGKAGAPPSQHRHSRFATTPWRREEMQRAFDERFRAKPTPTGFLDFCWEARSSPPTRELFAESLIRAIKGGKILTPDQQGRWRLVKGWRDDPAFVEEFKRDEYEAILDLEASLAKKGTPESEIRRLLSFLNAAAVCDPTIPVKPLARMIGVVESDLDEFIDWLDGVLGVDQPNELLEDRGFGHPGFPPAELLYRFRKPELAAAVRSRNQDLNKLALDTFNFFERQYLPSTRATAKFFLRLTRQARLTRESEVFEGLLGFWSSLVESERVGQAVQNELSEGNLSPDLLWTLIYKSAAGWPPIMRLALLRAYGNQPCSMPDDRRTRYLLLLGRTLLDTAKYAEAREAAREALRRSKVDRSWSSELSAEGLLGSAEVHLGNLADAARSLERAKALSESNLPPDHRDVATSLNNLALLYRAQGSYAKAEPLYERALAIREKALGPDHPDVATSLNNLAGLYRAQGSYAKAEPLCERALAISERALGPDHPDVAGSLNNLAALYNAQGSYAKAEPLYERALAIHEKSLGPDHPDVATSLDNLALLYGAQGSYAKAEPICERALAIREKALGPDHPDVATSLNNLAGLYDEQGSYAKAEPLYERALAIYEKALGPDHPDVVAVRESLAGLYRRRGRTR